MFLDIRLPENISFGATGGPSYQTDVVILASGFEQRNARWTDSRRKYDISYVKNEEELHELAAFFHAVKGKAYSFRFKDFQDYKVVGGIIQLPDPSTNTGKLVKVYNSYGNLTYRTINKPVENTITIYEGSNEYIDYSIDYDTGDITFGSGVDYETLTWNGQFDVHCRFDTDELQASMMESVPNNRLYQLNNVSVIEVRE